MKISKNPSSATKQDKIVSSRKKMFLWIIVVSTIVGISVVVGISIVRQMIFHAKVSSRAYNTISTIKKNNATLESLRADFRALATNDKLTKLKADEGDSALQVVLDALPAVNNKLSLGASLQEKIIGHDNVRVEALTFEGEAIDTTSNPSSDTTNTSASVTNQIERVAFNMTVIATDIQALQDMLMRFENSIRAIGFDRFSLENSGGSYTLTISGYAYYQSAKTLNLNEEVVKP